MSWVATPRDVEHARDKTNFNPADDAPAALSDRIRHATPAFRQTILALFSAGFATFALLYCVQPLLPVFSRQFGIGAASASLSLSLTTGGLAVAMLVAGALSEIFGRKPIMLASLVVASGLTVLCSQLTDWPTLLFVRALTGLALSGLPAVAMAYVSEEMHPRSLGLAMGLYVGGTGLGGMAGRLLTGILTDWLDWRVAVLVIGLLGLVSAAILWRSLPPSRHFVARPARFGLIAETYKAHLRDPMLPMLFAEGFLLMGSFVTAYNYIGFRLLAAPFSLSQSAIGLIFTVYLLGVASSSLTGWLSSRFGRSAMLPASLCLMLAGIALTLSSVLPVIILGIALLTFGFFGGHAVASAWIGARAREGKAQASSLYLFAYYLGSSVMGSLGGLAWSFLGWSGVASLTGALLIAALLVAFRLAGLLRQSQTPRP